MARTGRRPGDSGTREAILAAARAGFARNGYERTTIRGVAREAGVDPGLVRHFFGPKADLFAAAMELPVNPAEAIGPLLAGPRAELGVRVARFLVGVWDTVPDDNPLLAMLRGAATSEQAATMLRDFFGAEVLPQIAVATGAPDGELRAAMAASQILGVVLTRYVIGLEPLASAPADEVARRLGAALQVHLFG